MGRLPPAEKLPLALRKNVRDQWESKQEELEKKLTEILGIEWKIEASAPQLYVYAGEGYAKQSLGNCIYQYFSDTINNIKTFVAKNGDESKDEINGIAHAHVLTLDEDGSGRFSYCGVDIHEGQLRVLFREGKMGTNINSACDKAVLMKALNEAPAAPDSDSKVSYHARQSIRTDYDAKIAEIRKKAVDLLQKDNLVLDPNFDENFAALKEAAAQSGSGVKADFDKQLGNYTRLYFEGFVYQLKTQKFGSDELLQEGFNEAVEKGECKLRIVEKLTSGTYNEVIVEDGICYLQTVPKYFGTNVDSAAQKLTDQL